jgi:adenylate cyclase
MVVGNIGAPGRINYTIVGDAVNTGQRLEALGKEVDEGADAVALCSQSVIDRLHAALDPPPLGIGGHRLSGRREPIEVWRLA